MGLAIMVIGLAVFLGSHTLVTLRPPRWTRHVTELLVWPAIIAIVAAYVPGEIKRVLKHPMLVGVKLWAVAHLFSNGDLGSIILFGSILAWAVYDRVSLKRRTDAPAPAVATGGGYRNDFIVVVVGTLVYFVLGFWFHPWVIGVPVFGS